MPGSETSKVVRGASAPASSSSRSSSSRGLGQYCGAGTGQSCQTGRPDTVARMVAPVVVAEIVRSGFVEGHHYGSWVALDADGSVRGSAGDVEGPILPRSCNKPLQALAMLEAGLSLEPQLLALACGVALGRALPHRGGTPHPRLRGPVGGRAADPGGLPARRRGA